MKWILISLLLTSQLLYSQDVNSKHRQFDFWIGAWDVNLRVKQADGTWKDQHQSIAHIHSILDGSAILELWEEQGRPNGILGYSLRYYDADLDQWVLWLNWPGLNRSGSSSLKGQFRHGRGEFFSRSGTDSTAVISRYTFSDVTENSLRWDDAFSRDGGKTWTNNWIMEFTRKSAAPPDLQAGNQNHTNSITTRCSLESFDVIKEMVTDNILTSKGAELRRYGVLEGCGMISMLESDDYSEFSILTFNTFAQIYEELVFDTRSKKAEIYYGQLQDDTLTLVSRDKSRKRVLSIDKSFFQLQAYQGEESVLDIAFKK